MRKKYILPTIFCFALLSSFTVLAQKPNDTLRRKDANGWDFIQIRSYNLLMAEGYSFNGMKEGVWTEYHTTSYPASTTTYLHGKKDGLAMKISGSGNVQSIENYKDDKLEGPYRAYNNEGVGILEESYYSEGKKHGGYTKWYPNGKKQESGTYRYDKREGKSIWYYESGSLAAEYHYADSEIDGDVSTYYKNGKLSAFGPYKNGKQTGNWKEYYENGNLKAEGNYTNGDKEGQWKNYDDKGMFTKNTTYSKGEIK